MKTFCLKYDRTVRLNCVATIMANDRAEAYLKFKEGDFESDEQESMEVDSDDIREEYIHEYDPEE